jgi:hypothetical protein
VRTCLLITALLLSACSSSEAPSEEALDARRFFIAKANRVLRPGVELSIADVDALLDRTNTEIIEEFLADRASSRAVFRIGLDVLGVPNDRPYVGEQWDGNATRYWPATAATRAFRIGGDPLAELKSLTPTPPLGVVQGGDPGFVEFLFPGAELPYDADAPTLRAATFALVMDRMDANIAFLETQPEPFDIEATCDELVGPSVAINYDVVIGAPQVFENGRVIIDEALFRLYDKLCFTVPPEGEFPPRSAMVAQARAMKAALREMFEYYEPLYRTWEADPDSALEPADYGVLRLEPYYATENRYYERFWLDAPNSSTNYNRRRGAYMLDRYFCDDLRPVGAALPEVHGEARHASDPACQACHFKLDPMAGFFRRHGYEGFEFTDAVLADSDGTIFFDDGASIDFARYESAWRAPTGSGRELEIGYIRSTTDPAQNSYGSSFADLAALVATAPEVDRCIAQRMWESVIGADQAVDPGFLDDVARELRDGGSDGFRSALVRIVDSATFHARDRNTSVCYDLAPDAVASKRPPCAVASTLQTYCSGCHAPGVRQGGLDLLTWTTGADGEASFPHVDGAGRAVSRDATLAAMIDRLRTSDPGRQMPMSGAMPIHVREQLVVWLEEQQEK